MNKGFLLRDAFFLLSGLLLLMYTIVIRGVIDLNMSVLFIVLYIFYVAVVFQLDRMQQVDSNSEVTKKAALAANMTELDGLRSYGTKPKSVKDDPEMNYDFEN